MKWKNDIYLEIREYIKNNHGFCSEDLVKTELWKIYLREMEELKQFDNKKVVVNFSFKNEVFGKIQQTKIGKIKFEDNKLKFYEGKKRRKYFNIDVGLFEGWFATIIPQKIESI